MFVTFVTAAAVPVHLAGMPYGSALALPQFLGFGTFAPGNADSLTDEDHAAHRWEDDGGRAA